MIVTFLAILKVLLGFGLAGVLIIIGAIAVLVWIAKKLLSGAAEAVATGVHRANKKGGEK